MLDVHPPHTPTHTWRDFFIHIATIVIGLLIAVGLEQSVEWLHHRHERHQLQHDLVIEAENNLEVIKLNDVYFHQQGSALAALRTQVDSLRGHPADGPHRAAISTVTGSNRYFFPDAPVWNTAKESGLVTLLPRREAALYDLVYGQNDLVTIQFHKYDETLGALRDFCLRFTADPSRDLDLTTLSPDDLQQYKVLLANLQGEMERFRHKTDVAQAITQQAARGEANDEHAFEQIGISTRH
jgi:hypothetical protein